MNITKLLGLLILATVSMFVTSCTDDTSLDDSTASKTIFVFMPYSGPQYNLYNAFLTNIKDMKSAIKERKGLGRNRIIVYLSTSGNSGKLFELTYSKGECKEKLLQTYTEYDHTTSAGIQNLLNEVKGIAPAQTYAMIVGCHGDGWLPKSKEDSKLRYFGGTSDKYKIDVVDFAEAIQRSGLHMQFVLFDDCYLSCVEVAYDLKDVTDYLIASTSEIMKYGMPYHRILKYLLNTPNYAKVCDEFLNFYNSQSMNYGTLGVTDCRQIEEMAQTMREINASHVLAAPQIDSIQDLDAGHWNPTIYFDFGDYVEKLCADDRQSYDRFHSALQRLVPFSAHTQYIYSDMGRQTLEVKKFSGITISDPSINDTAIKYKQNTAWWKATH